MIKNFAILSILFFTHYSYGQIDSLQRNNFSFELGGNNLIYSFNYGRFLCKEIELRIGFGFIPNQIQNNLYGETDTFTTKGLNLNDTKEKNLWKWQPSFPISINYNHNRYIFGFGYTFTYNFQNFITINRNATNIRELFYVYERRVDWHILNLSCSYNFTPKKKINYYAGASIICLYEDNSGDIQFNKPVIFPWVKLGTSYRF